MMKTKITIYTLLFFCIGFSLGQETIVPIEQRKDLNKEPNTYYYYKDINGVLDKYVGTWKYQSNTEIFEITFTKIIHQDHGGDFKDELVSRFKYTKNGVVIYNTYPTLKTNDIFGGFFMFPNNTNKIRLQYYEPGVTYRTIESQLDLEYIPNTSLGGSATLNWKRRIFQDTPAPLPHKLPKEMVLVKQ